MAIIQTLCYLEINAFALAILFIIFLNVHHGTEKPLIEQKLFFALLGSNALVLIFDSAMWLLDGKTGTWIRGIYLFSTVCYYILNPLICMLWSLYADYQIYRNESRLRKILFPMLIPICFNALLAILSIFQNYLFYIDENNIYHRGKLFFIMMAISFAYLVFSLVMIIWKQKRVQRKTYLSMLVFAVPPLIGGIIQTLYYGISLIWVCVTISVLIIFINIQNDQLYTDYLTGLFNRRQLDGFLQQRAQNNLDKSLLGGLMIDINSFKMINDLYGHDAGDEALKYTAQILKKTFRKNDFIARYGGDEFVVVMKIKDRLDMNMAVKRLKENVAQFNTQKMVPYAIGLSIGYDYYADKSEMSFREFLKHIDKLMYIDKQSDNG